jgi:hypothetical protein
MIVRDPTERGESGREKVENGDHRPRLFERGHGMCTQISLRSQGLAK